MKQQSSLVISKKNCVRNILSYVVFIVYGLTLSFVSHACDFNHMPPEIKLVIASHLFDPYCLRSLDEEVTEFIQLKSTQKSNSQLDTKQIIRQFEYNPIKQMLLKIILSKDITPDWINQNILSYASALVAETEETSNDSSSHSSKRRKLIDVIPNTHEHSASFKEFAVVYKELQLLALAVQSSKLKEKVPLLKPILFPDVYSYPSAITQYHGNVINIESYPRTPHYKHIIQSHGKMKYDKKLLNPYPIDYPFYLECGDQGELYYSGQIPSVYVAQHEGFKSTPPVNNDHRYGFLSIPIGLRVLPNKNILVAYKLHIHQNIIHLMQYQPDGQPNTLFGQNGLVTYALKAEDAIIQSILAIRTNGTIIIGRADDCSVLGRFNADGKIIHNNTVHLVKSENN